MRLLLLRMLRTARLALLMTAWATVATAAATAAAATAAADQVEITPTRTALPPAPPEPSQPQRPAGFSPLSYGPVEKQTPLTDEELSREVITALPHIVVDRRARTVTMDGLVSVREGGLGLLACGNQVRTDESLISLQCRPRNVNLALTLLGLAPGNPILRTTQGELRTPGGPLVRVFVEYSQDGRPARVEAHQWLDDATTGQPAQPQQWVFCGGASRGGRFLADHEGSVICLSNFASAVLDVPYESANKYKGLRFKPRTAAIPPRGTPVKVILQPTGETVPGPKVTWMLTIDKMGNMAIDGKPSSLEDLEDRLKKAENYVTTVQLFADPESAAKFTLLAVRIISQYGLNAQLKESSPASPGSPVSPVPPELPALPEPPKAPSAERQPALTHPAPPSAPRLP